MKPVAVAFVLLTLAPAIPVIAQPAPPLVVTSAVPDPSGQTITVIGANFGARPFVTLDLLPVPVQFAVDSQLVASVPVNQMPPGTYLLTVSRGPAATDSGSLPLVVGTPAPAPVGAPLNAAASAAKAQEPMPPIAAGDPAARVGDHTITVAEVDREWARTDPAGYLTATRGLYEGRRRIVGQMITERLLAAEAAATGVTVEALLAEEIPKRTIPMPDSAVTSIYQGLSDRARGASLEQMRPAIRAWLARNTEPEMARMNYVEELMKVSTSAEVLLRAPRVAVERSAADAALGPLTAPVEIVVFGDFESESYAMLASAFGRARDMFGDRLRLVFKNLPVLGPESQSVAEAAACANAQGHFWPFHDAVINQPGPFGPARLKQIARDAKLTADVFDACVDGNQSRPLVRQSIDEAARYGIQDSPSILVNGQLAPPPPSFLPPFEYFKRLVEEALQRQTKEGR
jgi:protein-disulfide isomerase